MIRLLVGTRKGLFVLSSDEDRRAWTLDGPHCEVWPIHHAIATQDGAILAGGGNPWFGPAVWRSEDRGRSWTHSSEGLAYREGEQPAAAVWSLAAADNGEDRTLWAGVEPAGLFRSRDGGASWTPVAGLNDHATRAAWQPGAGGLILHHIVADPAEPRRLWVAISTAGVFFSADGGETWEPRNGGTRMDYAPEDQRYPEFGQCVHALTLAAGSADRLYQQNHCGMYRSDDGGQHWVSIEAGLPSTFGFPAVAHPRDAETLWLFPLNGDQAGRFAPDASAAVWRTRDAGATWTDLRAGLPQRGAYLTVLRQGMAADRLAPAGLYFGTTSGALFASRDEGESWHCIAEHLPTVTSVEVMQDA